MKVPFNKPFFSGNELEYIKKCVELKHTSGDGFFTKQAQSFLEKRYDFQKVLLTTSCTDALEMTSILMDINPGDEVIMPSYTFVSTANAFASKGAVIKFVDSYSNHPNIDHSKIEKEITDKTKAIVVVHYGGVACEMDNIMSIAKKNNLFVVEDAAQAIDSFYKGIPLGRIGHFGTFSFHETKNIISGEGGALVINDDQFNHRAEIIREKGTNRSQFFRGEVDKYGWVDVGSSFLPSDMIAAFLMGQLESLEKIQSQRKALWNNYYNSLIGLSQEGAFELIQSDYVDGNNGHLFYIICRTLEERVALISYLKSKEIMAVFHYLSLHSSQFYEALYEGEALTNTDKFSDRLLRLPLFYELSFEDQLFVIQSIKEFYGKA